MSSSILLPFLAGAFCMVVCNLHLEVCNSLTIPENKLLTFLMFLRLLLFRHHILDVFGGVFLGFFEAVVMAIIWIGPETSTNLVKWISDDRISGNDAELI
jgi:hypothetical protein